MSNGQGLSEMEGDKRGRVSGDHRGKADIKSKKNRRRKAKVRMGGG